MRIRKFNDFFNNYPKYKKFIGNGSVGDLFDILTTPENIKNMIIANDEYGRAALFGCITEVEKLHCNIFDLNDGTTKQLVGSMVKHILKDFGYENDMSKKFRQGASKYFTTAMRFKKVSEGKLKLRTEVYIEEV